MKTATRRQQLAGPRIRKPRGQGHERREEILKAARELFIREGYERVTTRKLAEHVGISQTSLYVYFKNKEEILDALCAATFRGLIERTRRVATEGGDLRERFRRHVETYIDFGLAHPDEYLLTFMVPSSAAKFTKRKDLKKPFAEQGPGVQSYLLLREQVGSMIENGSFRHMDVSLATDTLWASLHGVVSLLIARPGFVNSERKALVRSLTDILLSGFEPRSR